VPSVQHRDVPVHSISGTSPGLLVQPSGRSRARSPLSFLQPFLSPPRRGLASSAPGTASARAGTRPGAVARAGAGAWAATDSPYSGRLAAATSRVEVYRVLDEVAGQGLTLDAAATRTAIHRLGRYTVVTLLLHCCHTVVTLSLHFRYTVVTLLSH
jgi:hypothetical protein